MSKSVSRGTGGRKAPQIEGTAEERLAIIGDLINKQMFHEKIKLDDLARVSGVTTVTISNLKKGRLKNISLETLLRIIEGVGMELILDVQNG